MTSTVFLAGYLLTWQRGMRWLCLLGVLLLLACLPVALFADAHTAFGLSLYAFACVLGFPYLLAWYPLRQILSSRRLALVPALQLRAGLAMLALTLITAFWLPLASSLLWPGTVSWRVGVWLLFACSLYTALVQWLCTTRLFVPCISLGPFFVLLVMLRMHAELRLLAAHPAFDAVLLALSCSGWVWALLTLATRQHYAAPLATLFNSNDYLWSPTTWWTWPFDSNPARLRSPAGTLLLGYPDTVRSRLKAILNLVVISPLVCVLLLLLIGVNENDDGAERLYGLFLLFGMITAIVSSMGNGELAARARLLWLRQGGDRRGLWQFLERQLLVNVGLLMLVMGSLVLGSLLLPQWPNLRGPAFLLITFVCVLVGSYFSLAARIGSWPVLVQILMVCLLGPGIALAFNQLLVPLPVIALGVLALALTLRWQARRSFAVIDWLRVGIRRRAQGSMSAANDKALAE